MRIPVLPCQMSRPPAPTGEEGDGGMADLLHALEQMEESLLNVHASDDLCTILGAWDVWYSKSQKRLCFQKPLPEKKARITITLQL